MGSVPFLVDHSPGYAGRSSGHGKSMKVQMESLVFPKSDWDGTRDNVFYQCNIMQLHFAIIYWTIGEHE